MHGSGITAPVPLQSLHVRDTAKKPCVKRTSPAPPHVVHGLGGMPLLLPEPLHVSHFFGRGIGTFGRQPNAASSKEISRL